MSKSVHSLLCLVLAFCLGIVANVHARQDTDPGPSPAPVSGEGQGLLDPGLESASDTAAQAPARIAGQPLSYATPAAPVDAAPYTASPAPTLLSLPPLRTDLLSSETVQGETLPGAPSMQMADEGMQGEDSSAAAEAQPTIIQTQKLSSRDVASIGVLTEAQSGYSTQIWQRSRAGDILSAWKAVPRQAASPVIYRTLSTLALTVASPPPVSEARAWALLESRLDTLAAIGQLDGAIALLSRAPSDISPSRFLKKKADIALWAEDWSMACEAARIGLDRNPNAYWTNMSLACHAISGNRGAVDLLLDVLAPNEQPSRTFMAAIYALLDRTDGSGGRIKQTVDIGADGPLLNAIAAALKQPVTFGPEFLDASALAHSGAAYALHAPLSSRWPGLVALAYRARVEPATMLQYIVAAPPATPGDLSLGVAPRDLQRALRLSNSQRRVSELLALSDRANSSGLSQFWAPTVGYALKDVRPQASLWPDAGAIAAHAALAGEDAIVAQWYNHIRSGASAADLEAAQSLISVWPYAILLSSQGDVPFTERIARLWLQTVIAPSPEARTQKALYFYTALDALGYSVAPELWAESGASIAVTDGIAVDVGALQTTVDRSETGRGILLSLAALGEAGTNVPDPAAFRAALQTLLALGQERLARQLAVEVLYFANVSRSDGR